MDAVNRWISWRVNSLPWKSLSRVCWPTSWNDKPKKLGECINEQLDYKDLLLSDPNEEEKEEQNIYLTRDFAAFIPGSLSR